MSGALLGLLVGGVIVVIILVTMYLLGLRRSRREGGGGFVQHSRLKCPKCDRTFDYTWVPGAALNAVRLGNQRYMACPLCHKWSLFNVWDASSPPGPETTETPVKARK